MKGLFLSPQTETNCSSRRKKGFLVDIILKTADHKCSLFQLGISKFKNKREIRE